MSTTLTNRGRYIMVHEGYFVPVVAEAGDGSSYVEMFTADELRELAYALEAVDAAEGGDEA